MMRARVLLSLSAVAAAVGLAAACGGGDDIPTETPDAAVDAETPDASGTDAGADVTTNDASDGGNVTDAPYDGPTTLDGSPCDGGAVSIATVDPIFGGTGAATPVTITGSGFEQTPTVYLRNASQQLTPLEHVAFVDSTSIAADVPSGLPTGSYEIVVVNPSTCATSATIGFKIVANPPPSILTVTPATGTTQNDVPLTVTGCHFPTGSGATTLATLDENGASATQAVTSVTCTDDAGPKCTDGSPQCTLTGTIGTKTLAPGAYVLRVGNAADGTFGDYSSFTVTNPDGKLVGSWTAGPSLVTGRRSHGTTSGRIDDAHRFLYTVGGEDAQGNALDSVEVAPLDRYGRVGAWFAQRNKLKQARSGLALVRAGEYLYAIGGTATKDGTGGNAPKGAPLDTIERARILDPNQAPRLAQATVTAGTGTLATGTYYYKVSAIMGPGDADNPSGETLPSEEIVATLSATGDITLSWSKVAGAIAYNVYRSPTATSTSQSEVLLASLGDTDHWTDGAPPPDGGVDAGGDAGAPSTQKPLPLGSTGVWTTIAQHLGAARLNAAATVATDPSGTAHLYVVGGYGVCPATVGAAVMRCYEQAPLATGGGSVTALFTPGATLLAHGRMRHGADTISSANGPATFTDGGADNAEFVLVGGGYGISSTGNTVEYAVVSAAGVLGAWTAPTGFAQERDGTQLKVVNGYAYTLFGGQAPNYKATGDLSTRIEATSTSIILGSWSNAGANYSQGFGRYGLASESAFFYAVGGTTNDTDALSTVLRIVR